MTPSSSVYTGEAHKPMPGLRRPERYAHSLRRRALHLGPDDAASAAAVFTATAADTFLYTVTATSASGCTATASVTLTVVNARCGTKNDKVLVCHRGNTLCIGTTDMAAHLGHGDRLGACAATAAPLAAAAGSVAELAVYTNPAGDQATVTLRTPLDGTA